MDPFLLFALALVVIGVIAYFAWLQQKRRREAIRALGAKLDLEFLPAKDRSTVRQFEFLDPIRKGSNRFIMNRLTGTLDGSKVEAFDFHYETHSTDSDGKRRTTHHYGTCFLLMLPKSFPELRIYREGFFSKIAQTLGFEDIDFESAEFSRRYVVKSSDKKFAYDFCNARMINYLLDEDDLNIELEGAWLALCSSKRVNPEMWETNLARLGTLFGYMPQYLFENDAIPQSHE